MKTLASSSFPARKPFDRGGRSYGGTESLETMSTSSASRSANSFAAYPATMPPPRTTYFALPPAIVFAS